MSSPTYTKECEASIAVKTSQDSTFDDSSVMATLQFLPSNKSNTTDDVIKIDIQDTMKTSLDKTLEDEDNVTKISEIPDLFYKSKTNINRITDEELTNKLSKRSDSLSSLDSEAGIVHSANRKFNKSNVKKKQNNLKPRIKSKFGDATVQYIKDRLEGIIFSGWLDERQRLDSVVSVSGSFRDMSMDSEQLVGWRDVIEVDSNEHEMNKQLDAVMSSVPGSREGKKWINIKAPSLIHGYMLWLLLPQSYPPDHYWFRVIRVNKHPVFGLQIELTVLRTVGEKDSESSKARNRRLAVSMATVDGDIPQSLSLAWESVYESVLANCNWDVLKEWISYVLLPANVAYGLRMLVITSISLIFGAVVLIKEGFRLFMYFMREGGTLIDKATPMAQVMLNFFEKIFGGFYLLLAMVYRDARTSNKNASSGPIGSAPNQPPPAIMGRNNYKSAQSNYTPNTSRRYVPQNSWNYDNESPP